MESEFNLNLSNLDQNALRPRMQLYLIQKFKLLKQSEENVSSFIELLLYIIKGIHDSSHLVYQFKSEFSTYSPQSVKNEFIKSFYSISLTEIMNSVHKYDISSSHFIATQLNQLVSLTNYYDSFSVIFEFSIVKKKEIYFYLMKNFVSNHLTKGLLIERIEHLCNNKNSNFVEEVWIQNICSLPDRYLNIIEPAVSFKNKKVYTTFFMPNNYYQILSTDLYLCMKYFKNNLGENFEAIKPLSTLYGKISFNGYSEILFEKFTKNLLILSHNYSNFKSIGKKLFENMPYKYLELSLLNLIRKSSSYQDLEIVLQDLPIINSNFKHLLCDKFLFFKTVKDDKFIQTLVGYLYNLEKTHDSLFEIFKKLLDSWSNQASITNTPYEQHLFLSKCILVCFAYLNEQDRIFLAQSITKSLLNGVEKHLHSPFENIRTLGMVIGEILMNDIFKEIEKDDHKKSLKFDYEKTEEVKCLISLSKTHSAESAFKKSQLTEEEITLESVIEQMMISEKVQKDKIIFENKNLGINITQSGMIDSDDEDKLESYDLTNDTVNVKIKKPVYLRDCLNSLIYSDDPNEIDTALKSTKTLCDTYHTELEEINVELLRVLLSKSNSYSIKDFDDVRMTAMITVTCHYPKDCAIYLTSQFYEAGYSLSQRADILNVLVMTAQKLSDPNTENFADKRVFGKSYINFNQIYESSFQNLMKKKNNLKSEKVKKKTVKGKENTFSDSIGYFFFPLLNSYDKGRVYFSLMERDFTLLGKMIFSLAVILYLSENTLVQENMIKAFGDFLWSVKNHNEDFVKKSVIFAYTTIVMVIPENLLFGYFSNYFVELKYWLENVILGESKTESKTEAQNCLSLMSSRVKNGLKIFSDNLST